MQNYSWDKCTQEEGSWSNEIILKVVEGFPKDVAMSHNVSGKWKFIRWRGGAGEWGQVGETI